MRVFRFAVPVLLAVTLVASNEPQPSAAQHEPQSVLDFATAQIGKPYSFGATGLSRYDCSGLVYRTFLETGLLDRIGGKRRTSRGYYQWFRDRGLVTNNPQPGDLVVWGRPVSHIGIYVGVGSGGRHRAISALVSGVTNHRVDGINVAFRAYLRVDLHRERGGGDDELEHTGSAILPPPSNVTMNLRKGNHTLFRLDRSGNVLERRTISRSSNLVVDAAPELSTFSGRPHAQIESGRWEGWWRRVPEAEPSCCLYRFSQVRTLRLEHGRHAFKTFHANNRVVIRERVELSERAYLPVEWRATFNGRRHFLIADGPMAGTWVAKSSRSRLASAP